MTSVTEISRRRATPALGTFERYLTVWMALCIIAGIVLGRHPLPFGRGVIAAGRSRGRHRLGHFDGVFRACQPDFLAAGTADSAARSTQGSQINGVGRCTMRADDMHGWSRF